MAKDFDTSGDMIPEVGSEVSRDTGADCGGDIASDEGVDLNASDTSKAEVGFAKATMMSADAALPEDYTAATHVRPQDYAEVTYIDQPIKTPEDWAAEYGGTIEQPHDVRDTMIEQGRGPAPETPPDSLIVEEPVAEQHPPDPPEGSE